MLLSQKLLRQILGALWLIDGVLQLFPQMFTMNMVNGVMVPTVDSQPGFIAASLNWIIAVTTQNLVVVNLVIAVVQIVLGIFLLLGLWVRGTLIASLVWSLLVWYGGEGMSMLLTGQAGFLSGAPGAVLLYPLLGLLIYPKKGQDAVGIDEREPVLSRAQFRWVLAGFWFLAVLLQLQPYWWQSGQISGVGSDMVGQGGLNTYLVDPVLNALSSLTANGEVAFNIGLIIICLALGAGIAFAPEKQLRLWLLASIVFSFIVWYGIQGLGMILTGMATDFNSGLLIIVMSLACWSKAVAPHTAEQKSSQDEDQVQPSSSSHSLA